LKKRRWRYFLVALPYILYVLPCFLVALSWILEALPYFLVRITVNFMRITVAAIWRRSPDLCLAVTKALSLNWLFHLVYEQ
jgi:hypothetical protein